MRRDRPTGEDTIGMNPSDYGGVTSKSLCWKNLVEAIRLPGGVKALLERMHTDAVGAISTTRKAPLAARFNRMFYLCNCLQLTCLKLCDH